MGFPDLILRFRNASKGEYLAIEEHKRLLEVNGHVLWGWWRRQDEDKRVQLWKTLQVPATVTLISTSEKLQYTAQVSRIIMGPLDTYESVPAYYHDEAKNIGVWFELSAIEPEAFSEDLGRRIANQTSTVFTAEDLLNARVTYEKPLLIDGQSGVFVGLSDIHLFQGEHSFLFPGEKPTASKGGGKEKLYTLAQAVARDLACCGIKEVDGVLVSGDIVSRGVWPEDLAQAFFTELATELRVPVAHIFCVPGNHDFYRTDKDLSVVSPLATYEHEHAYKNFRSQLFNVPPNEPLNYSVSYQHKDFEIRLGFLNSARWSATPNFSEYGFVGRDSYTGVLSQMNGPTHLPQWKVLVLHHHLLPIRTVERPGTSPSPVSISLDSVDLTNDAQSSLVDLVVHGHQHIPDFVRMSRLDKSSGQLHKRSLNVLASGSSGSLQVESGHSNTYSLLSFSPTKASCRVRVLDAAGRQQGDVFVIEIDK